MAGGPVTLEWTELMPQNEADIDLIDSLWCTKDRAKYSRRSLIYKRCHSQIFLGNPMQNTMNIRVALAYGVIMVKLFSMTGQLIGYEEVPNEGASAKKYVSLPMYALKGRNGLVEVYYKALTSDNTAVVKNKVLYVLSKVGSMNWTEQSPVTLTWTEVS